MKRNFSIVIFLLINTVFSSCAKDNMEFIPEPNTIKIGEGYAPGAGMKVELYTTETLTTGYNTIAVALFDSVSNQPITEAEVRYMPVMDMGTMKHSAPAEHPSAKAINNRFPGAVVFTMPSGAMGSWNLDVAVAAKGRHGKLTVPLTIAEPRQSRLKSFVSKADNNKFWVALLQPSSLKVGVNEMELAIYQAKSMMAFPADSSLNVTLIPEMPTMGHGSPNNVNPVHTGNGHYRGKVNFTMTGLWQLNLHFRTGAAVADTSCFFEVNF